jgi:hypothetical protein
VAAFRLDLPPSTNDLLRPAFMGDLRCPFCSNKPPKRPLVRFVATSEAKDFREHAHRRLPVDPQPGPVEIYATFFVDRFSTDIDNRCKSLLDALKGRLIIDDAQVAELHLVKVVTSDESKVGVVVEVRPANALEHPELSRRLAASSIGAKEAARQQQQLFKDSTTERVGTLAGEQRSDARGTAPYPPVAPRVVLPEKLQQHLSRLARPNVVASPAPDDEPPEAA